MKYLKLFEDYNFSEKIDIFKSILNKIGIKCDYIEYLKNGSNGFALDIGDNRILKITNHKEEAQTAGYFLEKNYNTNFIVRILNVFKIECNILFPDNLPLRIQNWDHIYFIVEEKLKTQPVYDEVFDFFDNFHDNFEGIDIRPLGLFYYLKQEKIKKFYTSNLVNSKIKQTYKEIYNLLFNLKHYYNLNFIDFQSGNVGRDTNGNMKVFDVVFDKKKGIIKKYDILL